MKSAKVVSIKKVDRILKALQTRRDLLRKKVREVSLEMRVWSEKKRAAEKKAIRKRINEGGAGKASAGRPARWLGICAACCRRYFGEAGGPGHFKASCSRTQLWLKTQKMH